MGDKFKPLVVAEIGINHEGKMWKAKKMIDDAAKSGCECVKFQYHIPENEMIKIIQYQVTQMVYLEYYKKMCVQS